MDFSDAVKAVRQTCYLSQQNLADEIGVSFSTVNRWERARSIPNYQTMKRLVTFFTELEINCDDLEQLWKESKNA